MLFLISSAPDTKEFQTALRTAREMNADVCLLQNAVYAVRNPLPGNTYVISDDMKLRGIVENQISAKVIDYARLIGLMSGSDKVVGMF
jgi:sulfur relay protein TusB/DsrH